MMRSMVVAKVWKRFARMTGHARERMVLRVWPLSPANNCTYVQIYRQYIGSPLSSQHHLRRGWLLPNELHHNLAPARFVVEFYEDNLLPRSQVGTTILKRD